MAAAALSVTCWGVIRMPAVWRRPAARSCRFFPLPDDRVAAIARRARHIRGRAHAAEGAELVDQVRLIEVAAVDRDRGPVDGAARRPAIEHAVEAVQARVAL